MKLTKSQLRQIVKEELIRSLNEANLDLMSVAQDIMSQYGDKLRKASDESLEIIAFKKAQDLEAEDTFSPDSRSTDSKELPVPLGCQDTDISNNFTK